MPSNKTFDLLLRKTPLTGADWHDLVEDLKEILKPEFKEFELQTLGSFQCLRTGDSRYHSIEEDNPAIRGDRIPLTIRGVFFQPVAGYENYHGTGYTSTLFNKNFPNGKRYVWGLTEDCEWLLALVHFYGESKGIQGYERAINVDTFKTELDQLLTIGKGIQARNIWLDLASTILRWQDYRRRIYERSVELAASIETQRKLLEYCEGHTTSAKTDHKSFKNGVIHHNTSIKF